jgi:glycosyltransferase involved in cell wall biosynthesis
LTRLACELDKSRFSAEVYSLASAPRQQTALVEQLKAASVPVHFLGADHSWALPRAIWRLRRALLRQQPHIVQSFLFHANVVASWAAPRHAQRFLGVRVADPRRRRLWLENVSAGRRARYVCVSQTVADNLMKRARIAAERMHVIANGIDPQGFSQARPADLAHFGVAPERRVLLFVGRLDRQKGLDWLLELAPSLLDRLPAHDLVLAGCGPLESLARQAARNPRIHLIGWQNDVPGLLKRSDLLVLPSRWEGMPNVVLESMAAGLPILSTNVEGIGELLGPQAPQQSVEFGDTQAFLEKAARLVADGSLRATLVAANRDRCLQHFSIARMVSEYAALYAAVGTRR